MNKLLTGVLLAAGVSFGAPPIDSLLSGLDELYRQVSDIKAEVTLTQQKTDQGAKKLEMIYYRRDSDKSFLIFMTGPEAEKGNGYLRVGDNFWMYRKNTRTFQHINRDESIGGSDAHGDDFEGRLLTEMYEPAVDENGKEKITEEMLGKIPVYRFEVKAKVNDVDYPKKVYWVRKDQTVMLKEAAYSASGSLMQTAYFLSFTKIKGRLIPVKQLFVDEFEKGNKTIVEIAGISTKKLDDEVFTKAYLENLSK
ncbi:MAG: outer membrane lipoprotein-sorting protein [Chitinispirillaceae bacterium]|nr:outer membrane lipoprotein-sorting protein [Chitinispirillaceae bacterium]